MELSGTIVPELDVLFDLVELAELGLGSVIEYFGVIELED